ncbi:MAG: CehA/McbA family metallohydrolase [Deltaproteobacteria bacterium]|nr:CehA/McbA family metallohydrolase [Deltaproteobacteria bacterium]
MIRARSFLWLAPLWLACTEQAPPAVAKQITSRTDLIGGPGALGEVGDFLLANDQIRVIVQGEGFSRGFGVYGGGLIDADLVRPETAGDSGGGKGFDNFSEMFPGFFLRAISPTKGGIKATMDEDGSARVTVTATAADFLFLVQKVNDVIADSSDLIFTNEYKISPKKRYLEITTTVLNQGTRTVKLPSDGIDSITQGAEFTMPLGEVILFGAGNKVFAPGAGFDLRYTLEKLYKRAPALPQLPGLVTPFVATKGAGVSYGFASGVVDPERSFLARTGNTSARPDDLLIPFIFSAFTGAFFAAPPTELKEREAFSFKKYFIVGSGDVASIRDVVLELREAVTGQLSGTVRDAQTFLPRKGASVVTFDAEGRPYSQHTADAHGSFKGRYEPGKYTYRVVDSGTPTTPPTPFEIKADESTSAEIYLDPPGWLSVSTENEEGRPIPAKCTVVGTYAGLSDRPGQEFLYDLKVGEDYRPLDLIKDTTDPRTREFIEHITVTDGRAKPERVRPGAYRVVCSRGIEFDTYEERVTIKAGQQTAIVGRLHQVVDTSGWVSGDYHLHSDNSIDSAMPLDERVLACAAEGLDLALSSDHNFVTDFSPTIARLGLEHWIQGMVGLELTTLEVGHFNGFPLRYDPGPTTKGSFEWSGRPPAQLFEDLRGLGKLGPEQTVVQVNHPRDSILGYFNDYNFDQENGTPEDETNVILKPEGPEFGKEKFSLDFDAIEILNAKRFELLRSYRVPAELPGPPLPENIPSPGTILRDENGDIAFPGGMDDWFKLLNMGHRYTATGNSDSHEQADECAYPRTYTPAADDRPPLIDELEIVKAMKAQRALVTNGPFIAVSVGGVGLGETAPTSNGGVEAEIRVQSAPWVEVDRVRLIMNGELIDSFATANKARACVGRDPEYCDTIVESLSAFGLHLDVAKDSWLVVEAIGSKSMWPVVTPLEIPSLQVADAVGGIAGAFGISLNSFGNLQPQQRTLTYAYGFTNPIFIDADGDGVVGSTGVTTSALTSRDDGRVAAKKSKLPLLMAIFEAFDDSL